MSNLRVKTANSGSEDGPVMQFVTAVSSSERQRQSRWSSLESMDQDRRGFRFLFDAAAEIAPEGSPSATVSVRVTEISLHGCYLETPAPFSELSPVFVKIFYEKDYFESKGTVIYVKPASGMGLEFRELKPHCRVVLQKWILAALRNQSKAE